jgi:hypothetical protein
VRVSQKTTPSHHALQSFFDTLHSAHHGELEFVLFVPRKHLKKATTEEEEDKHERTQEWPATWTTPPSRAC